MTLHLISILGLPAKNEDGDRIYRTATYRFPDGHTRQTTSFGLALADWMRRKAHHPQAIDRILWLGTPQSAWGGLLQSALGDGAVLEPIFASIHGTEVATQPQVDQVAEVLTRVTHHAHACRIVPPCADPSEQMDFVRLLSGELATGDRVVLDLTHGLRNQSLMLAQSALMLEGAFSVRIQGLFYGGLEIPRPAGAPAPAVDLTGLLEQSRLAQALAAFREGGDVRVLVPHLPEGGLRRQVANLGHAVAVHDYTLARNLAIQAVKELESGDVGVLGPSLARALKSFKAGSLAESQFQQAEACLKRRDYLRTVLSLFEGAISKVCEREGAETGALRNREWAKSVLMSSGEPAFQALAFLRNQMAHGVAQPGAVRVHARTGACRLEWDVPRSKEDDYRALKDISGDLEATESLLKHLVRYIPDLANRA